MAKDRPFGSCLTQREDLLASSRLLAGFLGAYQSRRIETDDECSEDFGGDRFALDGDSRRRAVGAIRAIEMMWASGLCLEDFVVAGIAGLAMEWDQSPREVLELDLEHFCPSDEEWAELCARSDVAVLESWLD